MKYNSWKDIKRMILTVKLMPGAINARFVAGGIVTLGSSCCPSNCHQRNCRSAITCYWSTPHYGTFIAGVIAIWGAIVIGAIVTPYGAFVVGAIIAEAFILGAIIAGGIVARAFIVGAIIAGAIITGAIVVGVNFAGAIHCRRSKFRRSICRGAIVTFSGANVVGAIFLFLPRPRANISFGLNVSVVCSTTMRQS